MAQKSGNLYEDLAESDLEYCSRCFKKAKDSQHRQSIQTGNHPCGKDCGELRASIESEPLQLSTLLDRGERLYNILTSKGVELDKDVFQRAIQHHADSDLPPKEVFIEVIDYGLGNRDKDNLDVQIQADDSDQSADHIAVRPVLESDINYDGLALEVQEHLSVLEVPFGDDVYYVEEPRKYKEEFGVGWMTDHSPYAVVYKAIDGNKSTFENLSSRPIEKWVEELDDRFSEEVLQASMRATEYVHKYTDMDEHSYRRSRFWDAVGKEAGQALLRCLRSEKDGQLSFSELDERLDMSHRVIGDLLDVLHMNESVERVQTESGVEWRALSTH